MNESSSEVFRFGRVCEVSTSFARTFIQTCGVLLMIGVTSACTAEGIHVELAVEQQPLSEGRIVVKAVLSNDSSSALTFLPWNTPFDAQLSGPAFKVTNLESGAELRYQGRMAKRRAPIDSDYITIESGERISNTTDITAAFRFCAGTQYQIESNDTLFDPNYELIGSESTPISIALGVPFDPC